MGRIARLILAVVLLAGWQAALVHPLEHVDEHGHLVHLADAQGDDGDSSRHASSLCDALSALTACLVDVATAHAAPDFSAETAFLETRASLPGDPPPFLSQAPPAVL